MPLHTRSGCGVATHDGRRLPVVHSIGTAQTLRCYSKHPYSRGSWECLRSKDEPVGITVVANFQSPARRLLPDPNRWLSADRPTDGLASSLAQWGKLGFQALQERYAAALDAFPLRTKALTSMTGLIVADLIAQAAEQGPWDPSRTARMAAFGVCWHGISSHYWYSLLDRMVMPSCSTGAVSVVTKMLADQLLWAPANTVAFYAFLAVAEGHLGDLGLILQAKLLPTVLAGYALWPLAHVINFRFVPPKQRLLYINAVNLVWTVYLSRAANNTALPLPPQPACGDVGLDTMLTPIPVSNPLPEVSHLSTA